MSVQVKIISTLFLITEIVSFAAIPLLMIDKNLGMGYVLFAAWGVSFISPTVGLQHELSHCKNLKFLRFLFWLSTLLNYSFYVVYHHRNGHHYLANTMEDYGHPYYDCGKIDYIKRYFFDSFNKICGKHKKDLAIDLTLSILISAWIFYTIGASGLAYQFTCVLGFYYTTAAGNFFQHYGLETLPVSEKDKSFYAWDDTGRLGKYVGFNLNMHSEHHRDPSKSFADLSHDGKSPRLPLPLPVLILLFPFKYSTFIMNRRLKRYLTIKENTF